MSLLAELPEALVSRLQSHATASTSGCDSSDCAFCQLSGQGPFASSCSAQRYSSIVRRRTSSSNRPGVVPSGPCSRRSSIGSEDSHGRYEQQLLCVPDVETEPPSPPSPTIVSMRNFFRDQCGSGFAYRTQYHSIPHPVPARLDIVAHLTTAAASHGAPHSHMAMGVKRADMISSVEFSCCGRIIVTGGVSKQLRVHSLTDCFDAVSAAPCAAPPSAPPLATIRTAYKISSLAWSPRLDGVCTIGDYDGQISQVHVGTGHVITEADAHSGRRIWDLVHSHTSPSLILTAADDRTARIWDDTCLTSPAATITTPGRSAAVCGATFHPTNHHLIALASSDHNVYLYDTRSCGRPLHTLAHHSRPVSYVRFLSASQIVSASTDGSLILWQVPGTSGGRPPQYPEPQPPPTAGAAAPAPSPHLLRSFRGHLNERNFVGLSVLPEQQLLACGSEEPKVYAFCTAWSTPLAQAPLLDAQLQLPTRAPPACGWPAPQQQQQQQQHEVPQGLQRTQSDAGTTSPFVSAVCWQPYEACKTLGLPPLLAACTSGGELRLLAMVEA